MATAINRTEVNAGTTGLILTDATFDTMTAGAGNGVTFPFDEKDLVVLKNDTGGDAVFTLKVADPAGFSTYSVAVTDPTVTVADGKTTLIRLTDIFKASTGLVTIECDVAGEIIVLNL